MKYNVKGMDKGPLAKGPKSKSPGGPSGSGPKMFGPKANISTGMTSGRGAGNLKVSRLNAGGDTGYRGSRGKYAKGGR